MQGAERFAATSAIVMKETAKRTARLPDQRRPDRPTAYVATIGTRARRPPDAGPDRVARRRLLERHDVDDAGTWAHACWRTWAACPARSSSPGTRDARSQNHNADDLIRWGPAGRPSSSSSSPNGLGALDGSGQVTGSTRAFDLYYMMCMCALYVVGGLQRGAYTGVHRAEQQRPLRRAHRRFEPAQTGTIVSTRRATSSSSSSGTHPCRMCPNCFARSGGANRQDAIAWQNCGKPSAKGISPTC